MKCFVILVSTLLMATAFARDDRQILKCLGAEEKRFHLKKETGPLYDLNQRMIGELIQIPRVEITPEDYLTACSGKRFSESWKLLELSIKKGKKIFVIPKDVTGLQRSITEGMIDDYIEATKEILLAFISQIQAQSPTPTCLREKIPQLDEFFTEIKYLQEDVDMAAIFQGKDQRIFDRLKNFPLAFEKCRKAVELKKKKAIEAQKKNNKS